MNIRWILVILTGVAVHTAVGSSPNVLVFLTDDQGWGDLSSSGNVDLQTPHVDSLKRDGVSFDRFYVCPVCSPTRAEFLTGRHHARSGVYSTSAGGERMNLEEVTVADMFKAEGYVTGAFGKWHNGMQYPYHPNGRGFDAFYGFCSGHWGNYYSPLLEWNGRPVRGKGFCVDDFTDKAIAFIERAVDSRKPFFTYIPYNTPHSPMQVPDEFWKRFAERRLKMRNQRSPEREIDSHKRSALAMCENIDWNVGRILERLESLNVASETIVVWFHDNGPNGVRWNGGMRGRKGSTDEGGVRSPLYVRWPGHLRPGSVVSQIASVRDLLPTLCDLAGVPVATGRKLDGVSLTQLLRIEESEDRPWPSRILINHWKERISVRSQRYRLDDKGRLYDMAADPAQTQDVSSRYPEVVSKLGRAASAHREAFMQTYYDDKRPFVVAHPESDYSQLPARDARAMAPSSGQTGFPIVPISRIGQRLRTGSVSMWRWALPGLMRLLSTMRPRMQVQSLSCPSMERNCHLCCERHMMCQSWGQRVTVTRAWSPTSRISRP